jgi:alpha-galactosidase
MEIELVGGEAAQGLVVEHEHADGGVVRWSVANEGREAVAVDRVRLRWRIRGRGPIRMFMNGWQSWSASGSGVVGRDEDPAHARPLPALYRASLHADPALPEPGELRSELVTALADEDAAVCLGFDGGSRHDGTFRILGDQLVAEAYLGGAVVAAGERRQLHDIRTATGDPATGLDDWARWAGQRSGARAAAPYQVGWCTWYHYFHGITEAALRANLARVDDWPFDVFQLDDGYQAAIGDWLQTNDKFPSSLETIAADIAAQQHIPGLWIAPFLAAPDAQVAQDHPSWIPQHPSGRPLIGNVNPGWGGAMLALDTTHPEVQAHLEDLGRSLAQMGWRYLKLDFTYAPSFGARWHDPTQTPAQRVRAGYDAVRRGAGDDVFILGCGAPLGPCIGAVDGMRIGPDVAPWWEHRDGSPSEPATQNAWRNTLARSFMHRRLWLNDPDCLMLRTTDTKLTGAQVEAWALAVGASGGMALVSDDLALVDTKGRALLDNVLALGRTIDAEASSGTAPVCDDLLDAWTPTTLTAAGIRLVGDPAAGTAVVL